MRYESKICSETGAEMRSEAESKRSEGEGGSGAHFVGGMLVRTLLAEVEG